jgi:hypothetical protein
LRETRKEPIYTLLILLWREGAGGIQKIPAIGNKFSTVSEDPSLALCVRLDGRRMKRSGGRKLFGN